VVGAEAADSGALKKLRLYEVDTESERKNVI